MVSGSWLGLYSDSLSATENVLSLYNSACEGLDRCLGRRYWWCSCDVRFVFAGSARCTTLCVVVVDVGVALRGWDIGTSAAMTVPRD